MMNVYQGFCLTGFILIIFSTLMGIWAIEQKEDNNDKGTGIMDT